MKTRFFEFFTFYHSCILKSMSAANANATVSAAYKIWIFKKKSDGGEPDALKTHWQQ